MSLSNLPNESGAPFSGRKPFPEMTVIGLMSGTSVDSIDAACISVQLASNRPVQLGKFSVVDTLTMEINPAVRDRLLTAMGHPTLSLDTLCKLNVDMGHQFANAALMLMQKLKTRHIDVDLISSHGQTLYHRPPAGTVEGYTLQIGSPAIIAERTEREVAADFRPSDMAALGQGAPLVPFADMLLFQDAQKPVAVQNIGGIANLTAMPTTNSLNEHPMAFDTGPGNMIMDALTQALYHQPFDDNGTLARSGKLHPELLDWLMANPYFQQAPPKSTGRELFGEPFTQRLLAEWRQKMPKEDLVHTATMFTVKSILAAYEQFVLPQIRVREVIIGGGGVRNSFLMEQLHTGFATLLVDVRRHEDYGMDSKFKEAIAFALLGYARKMGLPNNLPTCTGAHRPVSMGALWYP